MTAGEGAQGHDAGSRVTVEPGWCSWGQRSRGMPTVCHPALQHRSCPAGKWSRPRLPRACPRPLKDIISLVSSLQHWSIGPVSFLLFWTISFYNRQSHSAKRVCLPARRHAAPRTASPHFHPESLFPTYLPTFQPAHLSEPHIHPIQKTPERTARLCTQMSLPEKTMGPHFCASFLVVYDTQV